MNRIVGIIMKECLSVGIVVNECRARRGDFYRESRVCEPLI